MYTENEAATGESLQQRWTTLDGQRGDLKTRCEEYASWTLPYMFAPMHSEHTELQGPTDSIGARACNHLSNKIVQTLFTPQSPFFRITVTQATKDDLVKNAGPDGAVQVLAEVDQAMANAERAAIAVMDKSGYRTASTLATKNLIITGNSLIFYPEKGNVQVYSLRDFCVVRDLDGIPIEIMTRDCKAFETFSPEVQAKLREDKRDKKKGGHEKVHIYTQIKLNDDGKYHVTQAADDVLLETKASYPKDLLPWTVLSWNLVRGENYGRGLVEDFAGAFHSIAVLTEALVTGAAIAADIKFLVDPASMLDVAELNKSASGSFHSGKEGDITCPQLQKQLDFQLAQTLLERFERQIAQAFLMSTGTTRDAERVTALEIRRDAIELEQSLGGIYSHLAEEWQAPAARILLDRIDFNLNDGVFVAQVVTGMDTLARTGDLDNIQLFFNDLAMIKNVPEEYRGVIDPFKMVQVLGTARGVDYMKFMKSKDQVQQEQQQQMQQQQQLMAAQGAQDVAVEAGKQAAKKEQG